jgi:hypothetical protein
MLDDFPRYMYLFLAFYSYIELTNVLKEKYFVIALDDNILLSSSNGSDDSHIDRPFQTIYDVADACMSHVTEIALKYGEQSLTSVEAGDSIASYDIVLGGWSYGGVIATLIAERIQKNNGKAKSDLINVTNLILFDCPLFGDIVHGESSIFSNVDRANSNAAIEAKSLAHFRYCTSLLGSFYADPNSIFSQLSNGTAKDNSLPILGNCRLIVMRALEGGFNKNSGVVTHDTSGNPQSNNDISLYERLTYSSNCCMINCPGSHWTMLFGQNAHFVAKSLSEQVQ